MDPLAPAVSRLIQPGLRDQEQGRQDAGRGAGKVLLKRPQVDHPISVYSIALDHAQALACFMDRIALSFVIDLYTEPSVARG